jgi:hypothetical protein
MHFEIPNEEEELRLRFVKKTLENILNNEVKPYPTMIFDEEDPKLLELIRPHVIGNMLPFTSRYIRPAIEERLIKKNCLKTFGKLYGIINPN